MEDLQQIGREAVDGNQFTLHNFMELELAEPDRAVFRLTVRPESRNPYGMVHGGAMYTLADDATGVAAHSDGRHYVTQNGSLNFLKNQPGGIIRAEAKVRHRGRTTCLVDVDITGESGVLLATGQFTYFRVKMEFLSEKNSGADAADHPET